MTTAAVARVGDIVTAAGVLTINKDFSAGYVYDAILEGATVRAKLLLRRSENQRYSGWPAGLPRFRQWYGGIPPDASARVEARAPATPSACVSSMRAGPCG